MEPENLERYKKYGEFVLQKIDSVPQSPSKQEDWVPASLDECLLRLREAAEKTIELATSPVKIGVMGEFSSGKTLLLGSLIGYADALPISENPTTGNVTAIHIIPQEGFATTQVGNFTVEYLPHEGINECLRFMLGEANRRATAAGLPPAPLSQLKSGKDIISWCEQAWNSSNNLELRYLLRELVLFIRAYYSYGEAMCGGRYQIDASTAREGLQLAEQPMAIQTLSFDDLPPAHIRLPSPPQKLASKLLQNSFPLIRRVDIEVKISREIWDVTGASEFILLDFPGLGAANSGARDTFLSLRELSEVQTILVLLNGKTPGSDRANKIFTMMQQQRPGQDLKDLILVGVGRFDQLPLDSEGAERELDQLIDANQTPNLTEEIVFQKLKVLHSIIDGANAFTTHKDRIILLSPLLGLAELAKRSSTVKAGSTEFLANLDYPDYLERSKRLQQKWQRLSERLLESDSRSYLGRQLGYFAQDGGIAKLRELIQNHVATHGLKQLYKDTHLAAENLSQQQDKLKNIIEEIRAQGIPTAESPALIELRTAIENLDKNYRNFQKELGKEPLQDRRGVPVSEVVKDELTFRILNWHEWTLLFNKANNGTIALTESKGAAGKLFDRGSRVNNSSLPTKSDDFYPAFEKTVKELEEFARDRIRQAVVDLLGKLSNQIALERDKLNAILRPEMEAEIENTFGAEAADLFYKLLLGCDPEQWKDAIISEISSKEQRISPEIIFPLARQDEKHNVGQIFDWSPERSQGLSRTTNHQLFVLRLRDEITASASLHLVQYVSEVNQQVNSELEGILDQIIPMLQNISKQETLLRHIATGDSPLEIIIPMWLQILAEIATASYEESYL